jgi:serine/threonine protein kinase
MELKGDILESIPPDLQKQIQKAGWVVVKEIGSGGGGTVYRCVSQKLIEGAKPFMTNPGPVTFPTEKTASQIDNLWQILYSDNQEIVALKIPHGIDDYKTRERMKREIHGMQSIAHPALIKLIDIDKSEIPQWFVMEYHHQGILTNHVSRYFCKPLETLNAIRPIAEGLGKLHKKGFVHRDVKPGNIFVASDGKLVLGDFGIIFTKEDDRTRLTKAEECVGSRDWMPDWTRHSGWEEWTAIADIHMLAKIMYFMVSGGEKVASSQISVDTFNFAKLYPGDHGINLIYTFLIKCITNYEEDCRFKEADSFLNGIDELIGQMTRGRIPQLLFNVFEPGFPNQFPILMTGGNGFKEILSTRVIIPNGYQRFRGRARVRYNRDNYPATGALRFVLGSQPGKKNESSLGNFRSDPQNEWTPEMVLELPEGLTQDWYEVVLEGNATYHDFYLTDFQWYGE